MVSRPISVLALLVLFASWAHPAAATDPRVGIYGDLAGQTQQVSVAPFVTNQVYVLAHDYIPFRGYGLGIFADPGITVTSVTSYYGGIDGCGINPSLDNLHCGSALCVDDPSPVRLFLVSYALFQQPSSDLTLCATAPLSAPVSPVAPYYTPCSPVNSYPSDLAASPYGDGCVGITTGVVEAKAARWGSLKNRFE